MADTKISDLAAVTDLLDTDELVLARSGATKKIDGVDLKLQVLLAGADGWVSDAAATWTRTADQTFTVTGDRTAVFSKGTRLRWTQTTVKYGVVVLSSHAAGTTTVTIAATTDYVLTAAAISANSCSYAASPQGYPSLFTWAPTYGGFSAAPTDVGAYFQIVGKLCTIYLSATSGTSNATTFTFTLPAACLIGNQQLGVRVVDNSVNAAASGMLEFQGGSTTVNVYRDGAFLAWTAGGTKNVVFESVAFVI